MADGRSVTQHSITFSPELPVSARREEIAAAICAHPVVIVAGETGSGKTTQLPKICLSLLRDKKIGRGEQGVIGHTQPRRLAARTVATRIAEELQETLGQTVGCQVRFHDDSSEQTRIKLMTDGILLAEIQRDRLLKKYDVLIIDEAHERSLNIDFLLGYVKRILPQRPDLKVVITSATIDVERFSQHFYQAPVIVVEGRTFPVDKVYLPPDEMPGKPEDMGEMIEQALGYLFEQEKSSAVRGGDVLVFLASERDILEVAHHLRKQQHYNRQLLHCEVVPLYARLTLKEQQKVFAPHTGRRIVLSTNVAETSLTVPGIRYVIDTGVARISRYSHRSRVQRLPIENISQASANQRAGRCGRLEAGVCVRLYSERDFQARPAFTDPEIRRTNLASVILQMLLLRLGEVEQFPFIDPPEKRAINEGYSLLAELRAVDEQRRITARGRDMARLPVDPRLAAMLVVAQEKHCLREVLIIASALSVQDPRERPADKKQQADEKHRQWADERSDFVSFLTLWQTFETQRQALSQTALRRYCAQHFLSWQRMREWREIHHQLHVACQQSGGQKNTPAAQVDAPDYRALPPALYAGLHQALLVGLLSNIAQKQEEREYLGCRQRKLRIFPGSMLAKKAPRWMMAANLLETSQLFAHCVATIEPQWVVPAARHLIQREYFEPFWDEQRGMPMIHQRTSLYGLVLQEKQKVFYGDIDREQAHALLLREALVSGSYRGRHNFLAKNQALIARVQDMEARIRRRDLLVDDDALFAFYAARVPVDIVTTRELDEWYKQAVREQPSLLLLTEKDVLLRDLGENTVEQFPDVFDCNGNALKLVYSFDPGHEQDGVSLQVPLALLNQIPAARLSWLVPGLLADKVQTLLRALPKGQRKLLVPLPNTAERLTALLQSSPVSQESLSAALAKLLLRYYALSVDEKAMDDAVLEPFYRMNIQVLGEKQVLLAQGRDLSLLQAQFSQQAREMVREVAQQTKGAALLRSGLRSWDFPDLAAALPQQRGAVRIMAYPALHDDGDSISIALYDTSELAEYEHRRGLVRLATLVLAQQVKYLQKELLRDNRVRLALAALGTASDMMRDMVDTCFAQTFFSTAALPRSKSDFETCLAAHKANLTVLAQQLDKVIGQAVLQAQSIQQQLDALKAPEAKITVQDIRSQLACLWFPGFMAVTACEQLLQYGRYMEALQKRLERLRGGVPRDQQSVAQLQKYWQPVREWMEKKPQVEWTESQRELRWLIEEWRVALFAQPMKTRVSVSEKKLADLLRAIK